MRFCFRAWLCKKLQHIFVNFEKIKKNWNWVLKFISASLRLRIILFHPLQRYCSKTNIFGPNCKSAAVVLNRITKLALVIVSTTREIPSNGNNLLCEKFQLVRYFLVKKVSRFRPWSWNRRTRFCNMELHFLCHFRDSFCISHSPMQIDFILLWQSQK